MMMQIDGFIDDWRLNWHEWCWDADGGWPVMSETKSTNTVSSGELEFETQYPLLSVTLHVYIYDHTAIHIDKKTKSGNNTL